MPLTLQQEPLYAYFIPINPPHFRDGFKLSNPEAVHNDIFECKDSTSLAFVILAQPLTPFSRAICLRTLDVKFSIFLVVKDGSENL